MNLCNKPYRETGSYLCTWAVQEKLARKTTLVDGPDVPSRQRLALCDKFLFSEDSLYHTVPREQRSSLYLVIDDGWDVPGGTHPEDGRAPFGSVIADPIKFPYADDDVERLKILVQKAKDLGYAGLGVWIAPQIPFEKEDATMEDAEAHWRSAAARCQAAGVRYWKVDWGKHAFRRPYIEMMTRVAREVAPDLLLEHAHDQAPFKGAKSPDDEKVKIMCENAYVGDFYRTYDVQPPFRESETLCRLNAMLCKVDPKQFLFGSRGMINVESAPVIAFGLGCNLGIMKTEESDEVNSTLSWQRLCPPFGMTEGAYHHSERYVADRFYFAGHIAWWIRRKDEVFSLKVPAVSSRNTRLPEVEEMEEPPIIMACCSPETKAYSIAAMHRVVDPNARLVVLADVKAFPESVTAPIGVFGCFKSLTLEFAEAIPQNAKVYAQCLREDEAKEATDLVKIEGNRLVLDGQKLRLWGMTAQDEWFSATPAAVVQIVTE